MIMFISIELFRWLVCASCFLLPKLCLQYVRGVEVGQQMTLVLPLMAYGICVHQGAPLKSAGVERGVSQQWIRWGNPNISVFCLWEGKRAGIKDLLCHSCRPCIFLWLNSLVVIQKPRKSDQIRKTQCVLWPWRGRCALAWFSSGLQRELCLHRWPVNGVGSQAARHGMARHRGRNWWEVKNKCHISEGCCQRSWRNTLE